MMGRANSYSKKLPNMTHWRRRWANAQAEQGRKQLVCRWSEDDSELVSEVFEASIEEIKSMLA